MKPKCKDCPFWEYTKTLGSPDVPEWHCRDGFSPSEDCRDLAEDNRLKTIEYYRKYPHERQLEIRFVP